MTDKIKRLNKVYEFVGRGRVMLMVVTGYMLGICAREIQKSYDFTLALLFLCGGLALMYLVFTIFEEVIETKFYKIYRRYKNEEEQSYE